MEDSLKQISAFFPVPEYIGGQLKLIDSMQLPLTFTTTINKVATSRMASPEELVAYAKSFQQPDISDRDLKRYYTETSIADQASPSVTLIYAATRPDLKVQKINVFVKPDPVENDKVTGIYIEKIFKLKDTLFDQQLYWKSGRNLQINTEKKIKGITLPVEQVKISWDGSD